jgi:hypothetical protein
MSSPYLKKLDKLKEAYQQLLKAKYQKKIGTAAEDMIRVRTRLGYGVEENEKPRDKLAKLSTSYVKQRKTTLQKILNRDVASPKKSNLSLTGRMLRDIDSKAERYGFKVYPGNNRAKKLTEYAEEGSSNRPQRKYMHLSDKEITKVKQEIDRTLRAILKTI